MEYFIVGLLLITTIYSYQWATSSENGNRVTIEQVWFYGWITAVSTGLGAIPFVFVTKPDKYYIGLSNAMAGGMMIAASYSLVYEGSIFKEAEGLLGFPSIFGVFFGFTSGILFILITKKILDYFGSPDLTEIDIADANKMFLIILVMTLHSLTEGIGIGVSFGGSSGMRLGQFISFSLAVHNVPEGLAVAVVLTSRKTSSLRAALWAIFTSLPQPFMAIPAFIFIERFIPLLPAGLGFASGAMFYVAVIELLSEAVEDTSLFTTAIVGTISCCFMMFAQSAVKGVV